MVSIKKAVRHVSKNSKLLTSSQQRAIRGLEKQIKIHEKKISQYKANPDKFDNKGHLAKAPNNSVRQKIIDGRIKHLNKEIQNFKERAEKIKDGSTEVLEKEK